MTTGMDLIAEERQKQINNDNVSGECNDTALEEQFKIWFEKGKCSGIDDVIFHPQKYGLEKQGQKYTWSEEDEDMFQALNACIDATIKGGMNYISFDSKSILIGKVKNWVKSIKNRVIPQPKQEWDGTEIAPPIDSDVCG